MTMLAARVGKAQRVHNCRESLVSVNSNKRRQHHPQQKQKQQQHTHRATMMASHKATMPSKSSTACGFSIFAITCVANATPTRCSSSSAGGTTGAWSTHTKNKHDAQKIHNATYKFMANLSRRLQSSVDTLVSFPYTRRI